MTLFFVKYDCQNDQMISCGIDNEHKWCTKFVCMNEDICNRNWETYDKDIFFQVSFELEHFKT